MFFRLPYLLISVGYNQATLHYLKNGTIFRTTSMSTLDKSLHWMMGSIDLRVLFKYAVFPITSIGLSAVVSFAVACSDPWLCASMAIASLHRGMEALVDEA